MKDLSMLQQCEEELRRTREAYSHTVGALRERIRELEAAPLPASAALPALIVKWREDAAKHKQHGDCYRVGQGWGLDEAANELEAALPRADQP